MAAIAALNIRVKEAITVRNQLNSPLLRLPPEIRNRILEIAVRSTYKGSVRLLWTRACKQLWAETRLLPFALCTFSFTASEGYESFIKNTTNEQRTAIKTLHLALTAYLEESEEETLVTWQAAKSGSNEPQPVDVLFRQTFNGLQTLYLDFASRRGYEEEAVKRWIADVRERNEGVDLRLRTGG